VLVQAVQADRGIQHEHAEQRAHDRLLLQPAGERDPRHHQHGQRRRAVQPPPAPIEVKPGFQPGRQPPESRQRVEPARLAEKPVEQQRCCDQKRAQVCPQWFSNRQSARKWRIPRRTRSTA
jgi:hypothetical protein